MNDGAAHVVSPTPLRPTRDWRLIAILLLALALRVAWVWRLPTSSAALAKLPDQIEYLQLSTNLSNGLGLQFFDERFGQTVWAYRMPGYPFFVALCGAKIGVIRLLQAMLDTSTALACYLLGRRLGGRGLGLIAAIGVAVNPFLIYFCGLILSETVFTALLIWSMYCFARRDFLRIVAAALLCSAVMTRPSALGLGIVIALTAAALAERGSRLRTAVLNVALVICFTAAAMSMWTLRNERVLGDTVWTTTNAGVTAYDGLHTGATGASDQSFLHAMPQLASMGEVERSRYLSSEAGKFVRGYPREVISLAVRKIARMWTPVPLSQEYGSNRALVAIAATYMLPLFLATVLGLFTRSLPAPAKLFLLAPAAYFTVVHALSIGSLRYRIPADVPMIIVAASGLIALVQGLNRTGLARR